MCAICSFRRCPPACPSYRGQSRERGSPVGQCDECGAFVYAEDDFFQTARTIICAACGDGDVNIEVK